MSDLNKVIAFFVGLFVVVLIIGFTISRVRTGGSTSLLSGALGNIFNKTEDIKITQSPIDEDYESADESGFVSLTEHTITPTSIITKDRVDLEKTEQIPETGSVLFVPALLALGGGIILRIKAQK